MIFILLWTVCFPLIGHCCPPISDSSRRCPNYKRICFWLWWNQTCSKTDIASGTAHDVGRTYHRTARLEGFYLKSKKFVWDRQMEEKSCSLHGPNLSAYNKYAILTWGQMLLILMIGFYSQWSEMWGFASLTGFTVMGRKSLWWPLWHSD